MQKIRSNTPIEIYNGIYVKREDMCCPAPGPPLSKVRGIWRQVEACAAKTIGVLDASHSRNGWATAWVCKQLGKKCVNFFPRTKKQWGTVGDSQIQAENLGAELYPLPATRSIIVWSCCRKIIEERKGYMIPNAMKMAATVEATAEEVKRTLETAPAKFNHVVIPVGTGTIAAGVMRGFSEADFYTLPEFHLILGYSQNTSRFFSYLTSQVGKELFPLLKIDVVSEGWSYNDSVEILPPVPFPACDHYERKAWSWLMRSWLMRSWLMNQNRKVNDRILFWNIGA